jgi:putative transposase
VDRDLAGSEPRSGLIAYLKEENAVLVENLGGKVRLTDADRRRLARLGKLIGRKALGSVASIATPDTILRWHRELVATKYDGSRRRSNRRPPECDSKYSPKKSIS